MRILTTLVMTLCLVGLGASPGHAERRVGLVIGNSAYTNVPVLPNPRNDAADLAASLQRLGFSVTTIADAGGESMRRALRDFGRAAQEADMAVVYFAGHGMEVGGENWLIPVDAEIKTDIDIDNEAIGLRTVMLAVSNARELGLVILDACRNNPFAVRMQRSTRTRSVDRGFARVEPGDNMLVAYASRDGTTARDGNGRNSPFTASLLQHIETPGLEINFLFRNVRDDVRTSTRGEQQPFVYGSLSKEAIYLKRPAIGVAAAAPSPAAQPQDAPPPVKQQVAAVASPTKPVSPCGDAIVASVSLRAAGPLSVSEECSLHPKDLFKECKDCPQMVVVPAGSFIMGSPPTEKERSSDEGPQHRVEISQPFAVGQFAVTFEEWDACVAHGGCNGYRPGDNGWGRGRRPVINVSWNDAKAYVGWLSRKTGKSYRLLSEAEREYVARAGTNTPFWWGASITPDQANYRGSSTYGGGRKGEYRQRTLAVDSFAANPWSLYQVHGNVWEWVEDCFRDGYAGLPTDGAAMTAGGCDLRVIRGGSWYVLPQYLRAAGRYKNTPDHRINDYGLRVARTLR